MGKSKRKIFLNEPTRDHVLGTKVLDMTIEAYVKLNSSDQVKQAADCILDYINSGVQGITHDQANENEHFNIDEAMRAIFPTFNTAKKSCQKILVSSKEFLNMMSDF